jgi:hypothetical protein
VKRNQTISWICRDLFHVARYLGGLREPIAKARHEKSAAECRALPLAVNYRPAILRALKFGTPQNGEETVKSKIPAVLILCVFFVLPALAQNTPSNATTSHVSESFNYKTIDFPGATQTRALGLNNRGHIVGDYSDSSGVFHGYLLSQGDFSSIDAPGSTATAAIDINNFDVIGGHFTDSSDVEHSFLLDRGEFRTFD